MEMNLLVRMRNSSRRFLMYFFLWVGVWTKDGIEHMGDNGEVLRSGKASI